MPQPPIFRRALEQPGRSGRAVAEWLAGWGLLIRFGAQMLVLAMSPSSHRRGRLLEALYRATWPLLPSFTLLSALAALVVIRIVLATALSYGLSKYALDMLVRTLVLELIPLSAAFFVAVRHSLEAGERVRALMAPHGGPLAGLVAERARVLPQALGSMFAVVALATVSGVVTLVLAYLSLFGLSTWGLPAFTRTVGQVFDPAIGLIFGLKTLMFSLAVSVVPMVSVRRIGGGRQARERDELQRLARLLAVVLLIEAVSLVGNYY